MARDKLDVKFEKPPIHVTANGSIYIMADDILHSKKGQEIILRMARMEPLPNEHVREAAEKLSDQPVNDD